MKTETAIRVLEGPWADDDVKGREIITGGWSTKPDWAEYVEGQHVEIRPAIEAIGRFARENDLVGRPLMNPAFRCSDGYTYAFTYRGWAEFEAAAADKREGYAKYYTEILG